MHYNRQTKRNEKIYFSNIHVKKHVYKKYSKLLQKTFYKLSDAMKVSVECLSVFMYRISMKILFFVSSKYIKLKPTNLKEQLNF